MQFVLEHGSLRDRALIISKLRGQMLHMARHKFASNVCEKALILADPESRRILINEIITPRPDGVSPVVAMMRDQYASEDPDDARFRSIFNKRPRLCPAKSIGCRRRRSKGVAGFQDQASACEYAEAFQLL
jgi:hypothetical protein